jgi:hypothetical protein
MSKVSIAPALAVSTVQIYTTNGRGKVVGLKNKSKREDLIKYIVDIKKGEEDHDWYQLNNVGELDDVVKRARGLDKEAIVYQVDNSG